MKGVNFLTKNQSLANSNRDNRSPLRILQGEIRSIS